MAHFLQPLQTSVSTWGIFWPMMPTSFRFGLTQLFGQPPTAILNLWGRATFAVAFVEALVDFLGNGVGIQKSVLAGGSLAGYYRTDFGSGSTGYQAFFGDKLLEFFNLIIGNPLNFHGKSGGV